MDPNQETSGPVYVPPAVNIIDSWTSDRILNVLRCHEEGRFSDSSALWDFCGRDERLKTVLGTRDLSVVSLPFCTEAPSKIPSPLEEKAAEVLLAGWWSTFAEDVLRSWIREAVGMGFSLWQIIGWETKEDGFWWPLLEAWPAASVEWSPTRRKWLVFTQGQGVVEITPGDGRWVLYTPFKNRAWMEGAIRQLAFPCFITAYDWTDWAQFNFDYGRMIRLLTVPANATPTQKETFKTNVRALGRSTNYLMLEKNLDGSGFGLDYKDPGAGSPTTFQSAIELSNKTKTLRVLGQSLTTDIPNGGSYAAADVHRLIRQDLLKADVEGLATTLREQILKWWAFYNFGDPKVAPWPKWDSTPPEDKKAKSDSRKSKAEALVSIQDTLSGSGKKVDPVAYWEDDSLPLVDVAPEEPTQNLSDQANTTRTVGYVMESIKAGLEGTGYSLDILAYAERYGIPLVKKTDLPGDPVPPPDPSVPPGPGVPPTGPETPGPAMPPAPTEELPPEDGTSTDGAAPPPPT